jgi:hypothetical protein
MLENRAILDVCTTLILCIEACNPQCKSFDICKLGYFNIFLCELSVCFMSVMLSDAYS